MEPLREVYSSVSSFFVFFFMGHDGREGRKSCELTQLKKWRWLMKDLPESLQNDGFIVFLREAFFIPYFCLPCFFPDYWRKGDDQIWSIRTAIWCRFAVLQVYSRKDTVVDVAMITRWYSPRSHFWVVLVYVGQWSRHTSSSNWRAP